MNIIIEYLQFTNQLPPGNLLDVGSPDHAITISDTGKGLFVKRWDFEPKLTIEDLEAIRQSAEFQTYLANRDNIIDRLLNQNFIEKDGRRFALITLDELNDVRQWITDFKVAVNAATSLTNLKTGVAALPNLPQRTMPQLKNAMNLKD